MAVWLVRAGKHGERQDFALDNDVVVIGWDNVPDVNTFKSRADLKAFFARARPDASVMKLALSTGQVWNFARNIKIGDYVALPLKGQSAVAFGKIARDYEYKGENPPGAKHVRRVQWISQDTPRNSFDRDILNSLGSLLTVSQLRAENAERRMLSIVQGKPEIHCTPKKDDEEMADESGPSVLIDLERSATDEIRGYIGQKFPNHELATLVDAVLKAQGYRTQVSSPGPDGGVDIIAGRGLMGFDPPRLCVQVKATKGKQDVKILRELKGVMQDFGAEQGLLVSWGGFTREARNEARRMFFGIRLWDADDLVTAVLQHYDQFSEDLKADLPLKRIWTVVHEEE